MSEVQRFYEKIGKKPKVFQEVRVWYKDSHYTDAERSGFVHDTWEFPCQPNS